MWDIINKFAIMKYFKQEKDYTCGPACFRMVMSEHGLPDIEEEKLEEIMGTSDESGTYYDLMVEAGHKFDLSVIHGQKVTIDFIDKLAKSGWTVIVAYSLDAPHYSIYSKHDKDKIYLIDPIMGEDRSFPYKDFEDYIWAVEISRYKVAIAELGLKLDSSMDTKCWYVAYKKKS